MAGAATFGWNANAQDTTCRTTLSYSGVSYGIYEVTEEIGGEGDLVVGTEKGCGDNGPWSKELALSRIAGVDPRTALVTPVAAHVLYVAEGVTVDELPPDVARLVAP